jgi:threonine/homoserine/homoserine lactone efflux protein
VVSFEQVIALALACVLLIVVPGPSVLFVIGRALTYGRATALASVAGNTAGTYLAAICIALGIGPLLERSALLFDVIRIAGAAYLIWLGITALRHARAPAGLTEAGDSNRTLVPSRWAAFRVGVLVGISNPKVFIILAAILSQFVDRSAGSVPLQMLLLAIVPILIGLLTDSAWGLAAGAARTWFADRPRRLRLAGRACGLSMIALGASVAFSSSPQNR